MTVIPDKHTFTIWQGATFFEVLTLYETMDKASPRDFCTSTAISGLTVSTEANLTAATLSATTNIVTDSVYSISSATIPAANNIYFTTPPVSTSITLSSSNGVTTSTNPNVATINKRTLGYSAEMLIRNKPQGTILHALRTTNHPNYNDANTAIYGPVPNSLIELPIEPSAKGQIKLNITPTVTQAISWKTAVYDLTITNASTGVTDALLYGGIKVNGV